MVLKIFANIKSISTFCCVISMFALAPSAFGGAIIIFDEDGHLTYNGTPITATPILGGGSHWEIFDTVHNFGNVLIYEPDGVTPSDLVVFNGGSMDFYSLGLGGNQADVAALPTYDLSSLLTATENASGNFSFNDNFSYNGVSADEIPPGSVLDQVNLPTGDTGFKAGENWQQQVTDGIAGQLAGITLYTTAGATDTVTVSIGIASALFNGPFAFTTTATLTDGGAFIDTSAANLHLSLGEHFVINVSGGHAIDLAGSSAAYAGGDLFQGTFDNTIAFGDSLAFETFILPADVAAVPEPSSLLLLLGGFGGLLCLRGVRRRLRTDTLPA